MENVPQHYQDMKDKFSEYFDSVEELGKTVKDQGPIDEKTSHLIQLGASLAIRSEGAVHSHVRRALEAGAAEDEIYHSIIMLTCTIGFPTVMAGLSWARDIIED